MFHVKQLSLEERQHEQLLFLYCKCIWFSSEHNELSRNQVCLRIVRTNGNARSEQRMFHVKHVEINLGEPTCSQKYHDRSIRELGAPLILYSESFIALRTQLSQFNNSCAFL